MSQTSQSRDWAGQNAPDLATVEAIAREAYATLPGEFRAQCDDLIILIDDFATDDMLTSVDLEDPFDLLGLFQGSGLAQSGDNGWTGKEPNRVWLFRRPILDYWAEHDETLGAVVAHVLIHEIGHHFGLSDDDMEQIEAAAG